jgi:hypothetical protein
MIVEPPEADPVVSGTSFVSKLAHELRTPLTSVLGLFAVLEDGSVRLDAAEARELATMGRSEAERMLLIIENLLAASRLARGAVEPERRAVDLRAVVRSAFGEFPGVARRAFVPLDRDAVALGDERLVAQIASNLVQNVARYAPDGEVEVRFGHSDAMVELSIADDGPGVPAGRRQRVFSHPDSEVGLGMGLGISRDLARAMGGELVVSDHPLRSGATFVLRLPAAAEADGAPPAETPSASPPTMLSPSARLLVDMTKVLGDRSLDRVVAGLHMMFSELLDADAGHLVLRDRSGELHTAGSFGPAAERGIPETTVTDVMVSGTPTFVADLAADEPEWADVLGCRSALFLPVLDDDVTIGVLTVGWCSSVEPTPRLVEVATALARLASFGAQRAALAADAVFERRLRSSVMDALPIAVSVFVGDPPTLVDWNRSEEQMLGLAPQGDRPSRLASSQEVFDVRFADGTPLTLDNAPVTQAIRTGMSSGPFLLRLRRADGSEVLSRTHCAPVVDDAGNVVAAVVLSEEVEADVAEVPIA